MILKNINYQLSIINYQLSIINYQLSIIKSIIILVTKKDEPSNLLSNLRPISLLNTDCKIATKAIDKRLEAVLPLVINADQAVYVKGRYISENIRLISDIICYTTEINLPGLTLSSSTLKKHLIL